MKRICSFLVATAAMICGGVASGAESEAVLPVTVCGLLSEPASFNHKLINISGTVARGFEEFTLSDASCDNRNTIWLEFGGRRSSEVVYCCGVSTAPMRRRSLTVEGIRTRLVQDKLFARFQQLSQGEIPYSKVKASIIGRYFSGTLQEMPGGTFWMGYGHFGMGSLLVIQQVLAVEEM